MLKKLIKHEFKDTMRLFIPMFGFIVVLTPIFSLMMSLGSQPYDENTADALFSCIWKRHHRLLSAAVWPAHCNSGINCHTLL